MFSSPQGLRRRQKPVEETSDFGSPEPIPQAPYPGKKQAPAEQPPTADVLRRNCRL